MKRRIAVAAALAATLLVATACGTNSDNGDNGGNPLDGKGKTLTVWLMVDAQSGWQNVVDDATAKFKADTGADVKVEYQQWANHLTKLDATLAGNDVPDVIELGNTEAAKYVFNGGFADITDKKSTFDNNANWLTGLAAPCEADGKLYCVPYYAGARVLIYRTDLFKDAGLSAPTTYDELVSDAQKLQAAHSDDKKFSAFYMPGKYWYAAMAWVYGSGGQIATQGSDGTWKGTLEEPAAQQGLQKWADLAEKYSTGDPTKDESDQDAVFAQGHSAMLYGNGWELGAVQSQHKDPNDPNSPMVDTAVKGKVAAIPLPGFNGKGMPTFLGGSVLGVAQKSDNKALAAEWIKDFTSTSSMQELLAKGALPNATNLLDAAAKVKGNAASANAAKNSWFVPNAPHWADVEKANILQQMLVDIVTGKQSVADATKAADQKITSTLNGS